MQILQTWVITLGLCRAGDQTGLYTCYLPTELSPQPLYFLYKLIIFRAQASWLTCQTPLAHQRTCCYSHHTDEKGTLGMPAVCLDLTSGNRAVIGSGHGSGSAVYLVCCSFHHLCYSCSKHIWQPCISFPWGKKEKEKETNKRQQFQCHYPPYTHLDLGDPKSAKRVYHHCSPKLLTKGELPP